MQRLAAITFGVLLSYCGAPLPAILPPNTELACDRAIKCEIFSPEKRNTCVLCLEHVRPEYKELAEEWLKDNKVERWPCEDLRGFVAVTDLPECVAMDWKWSD